MLKTKITAIIAVVLLTILLIVFMAKPKSTKVGAEAQEVPPPVDNEISNLKATMWDNYVSMIKDDHRTIDGGITVKDTSGRSYQVGNLLKGKYTLVFRYSFKDCDVCVDSVYRKLQRFAKHKTYMPVLAFTDSYNSHDFFVKVTHAKAKFQVYDLEQQNFGLHMENRNYPLLFVVSPKLEVMKLYLPIKETPEQIDEYLAYIESFMKVTNSN